MTDALEQLALALRELADAQRKNARDINALGAQVTQLIDLLVAKGSLSEGHRRHLARVARHDDGTPEPKVRLRQYVDKYEMEGAEPIDCEARLHLCKARCCGFAIELTTQDLEEGKLRWDVMNPYLLPKEADHQCVYLDRGNGRCTVHPIRPATCRQYSCRTDKRVWIDFEQRIPAPMPW